MKNKLTYSILVVLLLVNINSLAQINGKEKINESGEVASTSEKSSVKLIENPPIYPGCEKFKDKERKKCLIRKVNQIYL